MSFVSTTIAAPSLCALALLVALSSPVRAQDCTLPHVERGQVAGLAGGGDLRLADGRVVRLAGVAADFGDADHAEALRTALGELVLGRNVAIASAAARPDRHGRLAGIIRVEDGEFLQGALVGLGLAVVRPEEGYLPCVAVLMEAEDAARKADLGLWAVLPDDARDPAAVRRRNGRFGVIEGRIFAAGSGRNSDYLNFGRVWREDVTVRIQRRDRARFVEAGLEPGSLGGRRILVRGVIFEAGGPIIEARWPEQVRLEGN
jgi:endonuclease YncB( thermonuclease family)